MPLTSQRKRILVLPRLQWRLVAAFLSTACISTVVQMLLLNLALTRLAEQAGNGRGAVLEAAPDIVWTQILLVFGLMVPLLVAVGLLETFRVAGPVYRFETYLRAWLDGKQPAPCTLRQDDELHELCRLINAATQSRLQQAEVAERQAAQEAAPSLLPSKSAPATVVLD